MKRLLLFVCALFGFMACTQNPIEEQSAIRTDTPETIRVGFEDNETRIQLNEAQKTVWTTEDLVSIFYKSDANQKWQYQGETGERVGDLKCVDAGTATESMKRVVVVYPYNENYYINTDTYNVQATLPATQHYLANSYGTDGNIMVSSSEYNQFSLKSVCGWLKLQLTGDGAVVKSIKFRGNNDEQVAGELYINSADATAMLASDMGGTDDNNAGGNLVFDDTILTEVVLDCGEGITLGAEATPFYISLPPQTFANGFTVEIEDTDGYAMEQSTAKTFVVERNTISPMAALEFVNPNHSTKPTTANNEIWYTNGSTTEATTPRETNVFGANIVSNTYDAAKECWVIKFDGDVTTIGSYAFSYCRSLTSVTIPDSVTTIGDSAFYGCSSLTSVTIPDSVTTIGGYAFCNCSSLTSVTIPDSVTTIGSAAFMHCSSLTSVTIPDSVTEIGFQAFYYCYSLTSVTIGDSVTTIGAYAFMDCSSLTSVTIPDSVTTIREYAFQNCRSLTSVTIGDSVTTIGGYAFSGCSNLQEFKGEFASEDGRCLIIDGTLNSFAPAGLTEYTIPDSVTTIGRVAFYGCSSLTSVTIPDSVTTIRDGAFAGCSSLKKVYCNATIPPSLVDGAFSSNANGRKIYVYEECVEVYKSAWSSYKDSIYTNGQNCPDTTTIEYTTTDGNTITSSKLPIISNSYDNGVGTLVVVGKIALIPNNAFNECNSLTSVNIPDSVTTIGNFAFYYCSSLISVTIPDSVTTIGDEAFRFCYSLTSVYCKATTPPVGGSDIFNPNASGRKIYVPMESVEAYKSASYWSRYASSIEGYNF